MDSEWYPHSQLDRRYVNRFVSGVLATELTKLSLEFYPYFRFLGAHWAEDRDEFSKQFGNLEKVQSFPCPNILLQWLTSLFL